MHLEMIEEVLLLGERQNTSGVASACIVLLQAMADEIELDPQERKAIELAKQEVWESLNANMGGYYATPQALEAMRKENLGEE